MKLSSIITQEQQQSFQQQINWKYPERTVLKSWAIEVRDYNTKALNWVYGLGNLFIFCCCLFLCWLFTDLNAVLTDYLFNFAIILPMFLLLYWLIHSVTLAKKLLVYRFTAEGFEVAGWSRQAESQKKIFIGVAIVCSIIALFIVILVSQAFILLFIGLGGIVLVALSQSTNQQAWVLQRDYSQKDFEWDLFTEQLLYTPRHIITLFFDAEKRNKRIGKRSIMEKVHIFCYPDKYKEIIALIKTKVKNIPSKEGCVEIFPDECV